MSAQLDEYEQRRTIEDFPGYEVSSLGRVFNKKNGREMFLSPTQHDEQTVGLMLNGRQYRRSVKVLVARAFVPGESNLFNTPILLDGNRRNLRADNITWRPRWFSWRYIQQIDDGDKWKFYCPIFETTRRQEFNSVYEAAVTNGNFYADVYMSLLNQGEPVRLTGECYLYI